MNKSKTLNFYALFFSFILLFSQILIYNSEVFVLFAFTTFIFLLTFYLNDALVTLLNEDKNNIINNFITNSLDKIKLFTKLIELNFNMTTFYTFLSLSLTVNKILAEIINALILNKFKEKYYLLKNKV